MSLPQARAAGHTIQEWKSWEGRWELIHGVAFEMTPAPGPGHQRVGLQLRLEEGRYGEAARVGWGGVLPLLGGRLPVRLMA